ncbi:MAG: helix-turn-helix transcriptional regulator [Phascolarctobacterium sp.]|nr:helix-turn-helix transcriptional regulator [Phascolarctobacterium sp.]
MKIGQKIRALRKKNNMSANELAQKLNKDRATIYRYENGDIGSLPANILEPLAAALNVTPADLLMSGDSSILSNDIQEPTLTKSFAKLMASKDEETKELKIEIINDVVRLNASDEQLKALSAFLKTLK